MFAEFISTYLLLSYIGFAMFCGETVINAVRGNECPWYIAVSVSAILGAIFLIAFVVLNACELCIDLVKRIKEA